MVNSLNLQSELEELLGSKVKVYRQPPESKKLIYPCVNVTVAPTDTRHADNINYNKHHCYNLVVIHKDYGTVYVDKIVEHFSKCRHERTYVNDNLYHDAIKLYY